MAESRAMSDAPPTWHKCSMCKKDIAFAASYFVCSVSTCNRKRNPLYFCSLGCWEAHLPMMRHRDAWAEQSRAPTRAQWDATQAEREASGQDDAEADALSPVAPSAQPVPAPAGPSVSSGPPLAAREASTGVRRIVRVPEPLPAVAPGRRAGAEEALRASAPHGVEVREADDRELPEDVLVVVSKLKAYIKARSGMNTSDGVVEVLSDHLRRLCTEAIRNAARDGRRTVMDRDFRPLVL
ncbi:MAG: hypothetical protein JW751_24925 [Polyangiaceae bacterium]|nr:hypothetical protein [Polyangiaceae bacterium]